MIYKSFALSRLISIDICFVFFQCFLDQLLQKKGSLSHDKRLLIKNQQYKNQSNKSSKLSMDKVTANNNSGQANDNDNRLQKNVEQQSSALSFGVSVPSTTEFSSLSSAAAVPQEMTASLKSTINEAKPEQQHQTPSQSLGGSAADMQLVIEKEIKNELKMEGEEEVVKEDEVEKKCCVPDADSDNPDAGHPLDLPVDPVTDSGERNELMSNTATNDILITTNTTKKTAACSLREEEISSNKISVGDEEMNQDCSEKMENKDNFTIDNQFKSERQLAVLNSLDFALNLSDLPLDLVDGDDDPYYVLQEYLERVKVSLHMNERLNLYRFCGI